MREIRIYQPGEYKTGDLLELSLEAAHHVGSVLRMQSGQALTLLCGDNREFQALIELVKKKTVQVRIGLVAEVNRDSPLTIHLAQAISKGERMEMVVQKAVELGVTSITPIVSERCALKLDADRMAKKTQQWQAIAIAACEQSGRNRVPLVHSPLPLEAYLPKVTSDLKLVLHPYCAKTWREFSLQVPEISLLIGPEGGFSNAEISSANTNGFQALSLGPRILRTETAAITALSLLQALAGDL
jgi:16S rRNA (uracil1498-N3)-methyltransferase